MLTWKKKTQCLILMSSFRQVAVADLTIINKTDLVNEEELTKIRAAVRSALPDFVFVVVVVLFILIGFFSVINQFCIRFNPKLLGRPLVARWRNSESLFRKRFLSSFLVVLIID